MSSTIIAVGGTGNKILESVVYGACADAFAGVETLRLLSVDVDAACGNTTRAKRAALSYERVREAFAQSPVAHRCFHTALSMEQWQMDLSRRAASIDKMVEGRERDQLLSRAVFSRTEAMLEYSEGFRGHPDLGVLFFAQTLGDLAAREQAGQRDELIDLLRSIRAELDAGETVRVALCGSIFGGTGASGIPALARFLRARFAGEEHFHMAGVLMLPYYDVPQAARDEGDEIVVKSSAFLDKARTALQYYGMQGMIRERGQADGAFDQLYLLGLPPEAFITTKLYSTGSQSQQNDAHLLEWLATRQLSHFLGGGDMDERFDCYYYQTHTPVFTWQGFDVDAPAYRAGYGALLKAAAVYFAELAPALLELGHGAEKNVGCIAPYFRRFRRWQGEERAALLKRLEALSTFLALYTGWVSQIADTMPAPMRPAQSENGLVDAKLMAALSTLSAQGTGSRAGDQAATRIRKGLARLVVSPEGDRRDLPRVLAALGGGACDAYAPDNALSAMLSTLLEAVWEGRA